MQKLYKWMEEMKKKDEKEKMEEMLSIRVNQMVKSSDGSVRLLHKITKPTAWRGVAQMLKKEEEDVRLLDSCEAKRKAVWRRCRMRKEVLPRLQESELEKVSRLYKVKTGVQCDGFHPKVSLGFDRRL